MKFSTDKKNNRFNRRPNQRVDYFLRWKRYTDKNFKFKTGMKQSLFLYKFTKKIYVM